jgi:NADH-quinone oxidoreductase subunit C
LSSPDNPDSTHTDPPPDATEAEQEAPLAAEAAPDQDATTTEQKRAEDAAEEGGARTPEGEDAAPAAEASAEEPEAAPEPEAAEPEPEPDPVRDPLLEQLKAALGDAVVGSEVGGGDIWVRVERSAWRQAAEVCKEQLGMRYFCFLSGIDWLPNSDLGAEKLWDPNEQGAKIVAGPDGEPRPEFSGSDGNGDASREYETGVAGGQSRFQVFARVYNTDTAVGITLKADLDDADPRVESWVPVYRGADWHEREAWEMYGFQFDGHPGLRHIYLPSGFEGFPLRKDFPLLAREVKPWPGLVDKEPIPGEEEEESASGGEG